MLSSLALNLLAFSFQTCLPQIVSAHLGNSSAPTITLDQGIFTGVPATNGSVEKFLGIPFAKPPTGDLRFRRPVAVPAYQGSFQATASGNACPQQASKVDWDLTTLPASLVPYIVPYAGAGTTNITQSENCLTVDVLRPTGIDSRVKLPVVVWMYPGGFELGSTSSYDGTVIVERSITLGKPVILVAINYRLSGFGFLTGQEVKAAGVGNLGLRDQREALRWVQKYIAIFGGDHSKVTIWGMSAGSLSIGLHMIANNGDTDNLFHAAFMQSGNINQLATIDSTKAQEQYDTVVSQTGCAGSSDTLACLRSIPYDTLKSVFDAGPGVFGYKSVLASWFPRPDGDFITDLPQTLLAAGKVARIPFVVGDADDEGTLFALAQLNVTTDAEFHAWIKDNLLPQISETDLNAIALAYPEDVVQGSPFGTGTNNSLSPQFKRMSAFFGDIIFSAPRRNLLDATLGKQNSWSFISKRGKSIPYLGAFHSLDLNIFSGTDMTDYLINFIDSFNPNSDAAGIHWPQYSAHSPAVMNFLDGSVPQNITLDTFRKNAIASLANLSLKYPL